MDLCVRGSFRCLKCDTWIPNDQLVSADEQGIRGWNSISWLYRPHGHPLLIVMTVHVTSVYTAATTFPTLPDKLPTNLTSLNFN